MQILCLNLLERKIAGLHKRFTAQEMPAMPPLQAWPLEELLQSLRSSPQR